MPSVGDRQRGVRLSERDRALLRWVGEQYSVRADLLGVLMARPDHPQAHGKAALAPRVVNRSIQAWRSAGLVRTRTYLMGTPATVWLTTDGLAVAGLPWRPSEPTLASVAHRHAVGLVRAEAETMPGVTWVCERELREGQGGRPLHLPDGVVESVDSQGRKWRTAVEVELTRKTEARVAAILLRHLLAADDDVVYRATRDAGAVVERAAAGIDGGSERVFVKAFPPPALADIA